MKSINNMEEFYEVVEKDQVSFIYFYTVWCPDCFAVKPYLPKLEEEFTDVVFYMMNRDADLELSKHLNIYGIPSFLMYKSNKEIGRFVSKDRKTHKEVQAFIKKAL